MNTRTVTRPALRGQPPTRPPGEDPMLVPVLLWAGVLMLVLLLIYVQLVLTQVARGERLRADQRARAELAAITVVKRPPGQSAPPAWPIRVSQYRQR